MSPASTTSPADVADRLQRAIAASPADETELVWIEDRRRQTNAAGKAREQEDRTETTLLARVRERGRVGTYRCGGASDEELQQAIRCALAQARAHEPLPGLPHLPGDATLRQIDGAFDAAVADLTCEGAVAQLRRWVDRSETARLTWHRGEVTVASSRAPVHRTAVTAAALDVRSGRGPQAGEASGAARSLAGLDAPAVVARARGRRLTAETADGTPAADAPAPPDSPVALWLAPEATAQLLHALASTAFTAHAYRDGSSFLRQLLGTQVFDRRLTLYDDGTEAAGLPFPFDLEGSAKRRVDLIAAGTPRTPALDQRHAALFGLPATGHASGGDDARAENLFLAPGDAGEADLRSTAGGGIFVAALDRLRTLPPNGARFTALTRGTRRVLADGTMVALPDLVWEDSLLRALSHVLALGSDTVLTAPAGGFLGGVRSPALVIDAVQGLRSRP